MWEFLHDVPYVQLPAAKNLQGAMAAEKVDTDCKEVGKEAVAMRCRSKWRFFVGVCSFLCGYLQLF
jgi:hypothetical protein